MLCLWCQQLPALCHARGSALLARYHYTLDVTGNRTRVTETVGGVTCEITNTYDALNRQIMSAYSTGEAFTYRYDAVGNRVAMTSTTPLSGTVMTTYTFDAANRLTDRAVSDGRAYTYTWSARGQMLAEYTQGYPVRTFTYNGAGQLVKATVFTLTTEFVYNGLGARTHVEIVGQGTTTYTLDYAAGSRILAETTLTETVNYLYGHDCLGEFRDDTPLYYLPDAEGYVRQSVDADGAIISAWLFDPDGTVLEGPNGPVSHLVCGGVYDWSTGLLYKGGRYFDPSLGIWLVLLPLAVIQAWPRRKKERRKHPWAMLLCIILVGTLTGCPPSPTPDPTPTRPPCTDTPTPIPPTPTPEPPTPTLTPTYNRAAAVAYALAHANSPNDTEYIYITGNNCTNFVSQALAAGGLQQNDRWQYNNGNPTNAWWTTRVHPTNVGQDEGYGPQDGLYNYLTDAAGLGRPTTLYGSPLHRKPMIFSPTDSTQPGDVVFYDQGGLWGHAAIVVGWERQPAENGTLNEWLAANVSSFVSNNQGGNLAPWVAEHSGAAGNANPRPIQYTGGAVNRFEIVHM